MFSDSKLATVEQYLRRLSYEEKDPIVDHNYVKPWSAHPDSQRTKPAKMLFMNLNYRRKLVVNPDEEIDVVSLDMGAPSPFDSKGNSIVNDLERALKCNPNIHSNDGETQNIPFDEEMENWSFSQSKMYKNVIEIINAEYLSRIVLSGQPHGYIKRRIATEKCAKQLQVVYSNSFWDIDVISHVHKMILNKCDFVTVVSYLNVLQALRAKVPNLVDKIVRASPENFGYEYLSQILKRPVDPVLPTLNQYKPKKLPGNPLLLMSTAGFDLEIKALNSSRFRFWTTHLNALCKTMHIPLTNSANHETDMSFEHLEKMLDVAVSSMKSKVIEFKNHFPNRPVILGGWIVGALIACHVALEIPVDAIICFGFPLIGVNGSRGALENDPLLDCKTPVLFIIGQNANMCTIDDIEDLRSRMRAETNLVVIGDADDFLRISYEKMFEDSITQSMVDRCIVEEIGEFLQSALVKVPSTSNFAKSCPSVGEENANVADFEEEGKRKRRKPKEYSPPPEFLSSRKRLRQSMSKEVATVSSKARLSPSSSETSSSGSFKYEKQNMSKPVKQLPEKRGVGRPPSNNPNKKRTPSKSIVKPVVEIAKSEHLLKRTLKLRSPTPVKSPPKKPYITESKSSIPFALNILPKKNDPVDVEKAFGKDSSFLPRPLTPPEPEDTVSAEETEKAMAELETASIPTATSSKIPSNTCINTASQIITTAEKAFIPLVEQSPVNVLSTKLIPGSVIKPIVNTTVDAKKGIAVPVVATGFKTVFQAGKVLNSSSAAQLKNVSGVSVIGNPLSQSSTINNNKAMIAVPSNSATILVSGSALKAHSGKVLQLISKGPITLKSKDPTTSATSVAGEASEQQVCNLSLLSDVAGMTEPIKDMSRKVEVNSSSATLVKLAVPDKVQNLKRFQVLKPVQSRSPPTRVETPEEVVEKQLAIQALNKSIGIETPTSHIKESGYSICYAKPDGSIVSRAVPRPAPGPATYIRQSIIPHPSVKGRIRPILPNKMYRFCHK